MSRWTNWTRWIVWASFALTLANCTLLSPLQSLALFYALAYYELLLRLWEEGRM